MTCELIEKVWTDANAEVVDWVVEPAAMTKKFIKAKKARAMNSKNGRRPRTMQEEQPKAPEGECLIFEAYLYSSDTECDGIWQTWDDWCWGLDRVDYDAICKPVEEALYIASANALDAVRPEGECLNWDSYHYGVANPECSEIWSNWD